MTSHNPNVTALNPVEALGLGDVGMSFHDLVKMLRRRGKLICGITFISSFLFLMISFLLTPQYQASAVILLDQRQKNVLDMNSVVSGLPANASSLTSEIDIISSRAIADRVIKKLKLIDDSEFTSGKSLWALFWSIFDKEDSTEKKATEDKLKTEAANSVLKRLAVTNDGRSFTIRLSFTSKDPEKAAVITNAFADEYLLDQLEAKYETTARASKWLSERLSDLRKDVETAEKAVEDFRQKAKLIQIEGSTVSARQMDEINTQLTTARGQTSQAEARLRSVQRMIQSKDGMDAAADVLSSPLIQKLREQEAEVRRNEAELATRYGALHPKMINARAEFHDLEKKIAEEVQKITRSLGNEVEVARAKEEQMQKDLKSLEGKAGVELRDSVNLRQLQREADANRSLYESFLNRFKQTNEQQDMQLADSRIIERADTPASPAFPKKLLFLLWGFLTGAFIGVAVAYLLDYFDSGFRLASQVEELTGLPTIGVIPNLATLSGRPPEDYVIDKPMSAYSESLRSVRTAIHFSNVDNPPQTIMVTSSTPKEGKTTFCLSLGRTLAKSGQKILVIDADMRRPSVAKALGLANEKKGGLLSLLSGKKTFDEIVRPDPIVSGLDIIPSYGKTANAPDLLGSKQMQQIIETAKKKYSLIIIDTAPVLAVTDMAFATKYVDSVVLLVRWATTPREMLLRSVQLLKNFGCHIAGIVLTQVNVDELSGYGDNRYHRAYNDYYTD